MTSWAVLTAASDYDHLKGEEGGAPLELHVRNFDAPIASKAIVYLGMSEPELD